jgi:hypothetical protein
MTATEATYIELTEDEFDQQYQLIPNHLNPSAGWAIGDQAGCLFETYGDEYDYVRRFDPARIWTIVDGDDGDIYVVNGLHHVNRIGYLLSREPVPANTAIQVHIPMSKDDDDIVP